MVLRCAGRSALSRTAAAPFRLAAARRLVEVGPVLVSWQHGLLLGWILGIPCMCRSNNGTPGFQNPIRTAQSEVESLHVPQGVHAATTMKRRLQLKTTLVDAAVVVSRFPVEAVLCASRLQPLQALSARAWISRFSRSSAKVSDSQGRSAELCGAAC